jgi:hypothetical protein
MMLDERATSLAEDELATKLAALNLMYVPYDLVIEVIEAMIGDVDQATKIAVVERASRLAVEVQVANAAEDRGGMLFENAVHAKTDVQIAMDAEERGYSNRAVLREIVLPRIARAVTADI